MSPHELPAELDRWPSDPHALLGVPANVGPRDLKRAYTQLIRVYKPEQFPDHFRRLREAYETVLRQVEFRARFQTSSDPAEPGPSYHEAAPIAESTTPSWNKQLNEIWETAVSGLEEVAYRRFAELEQLRPGHPDLCVRLYWLLALSPELDSGHDAPDWLVKGMLSGGLSGPLYELYRRQLETDPRKALGDRSRRLFGTTAVLGALAGYAEQRWRAAAACGDAGPLVASDLDRLQALIAGQDEEIWVRLLLTAVEFLAWSDARYTRELAAHYRREIEAAEHLHRRLEYLIDRADMGLEIANVWRSQRIFPDLSQELVLLVRQSRLLEFAQVRPQLETYLAGALKAPAAMLKILSGMARQSSVALMAFGELLEHWNEIVQRMWFDRNTEPTKTVVREFVRRTNFHDYDRWRPRVLDFCLSESLLAEELAGLIEQTEIEGAGDAAGHILRDQPLQYVVLAALLFWA